MAIFKKLFAENGIRNTIPMNSQSSGNMSIETGWTIDYARTPISGGKFVQLGDMNEAFHYTQKGVNDLEAELNDKIDNLITEYTSSLSSDPLVTCQGGFDLGTLQIRFGNKVNFENYTTQKVTFENPFRNQCIGINVTPIYSKAGCILNIDKVDKNGFEAYSYNHDNTPQPTSFRWIAIGF